MANGRVSPTAKCGRAVRKYSIIMGQGSGSLSSIIVTHFSSVFVEDSLLEKDSLTISPLHEAPRRLVD